MSQVAGTGDNTARVWEASSGTELARITHNGAIVTVAFSLDGNFVLSISGANITDLASFTILARLWKSNELIVNACSHLPRNLTRLQWDQYIGDALPYQAVCPNLPIEPESTPMP